MWSADMVRLVHPPTDGELDRLMTSPALTELDTNRWSAALPWLPITAEDYPNPARSSAGHEPDPLAVYVARCAIDLQSETPLNELLPTLPATFDLHSLDWPARHRNVLRRHNLAMASDLGSITVGDLLGTWSVSNGVTEAILARLFQTVLTDDHVGAGLGLAEMIRWARTAAGLSQAELGARVGTNGSTISAFERGTQEPTISTLHRIGRATGHTLSILLLPAD